RGGPQGARKRRSSVGGLPAGMGRLVAFLVVAASEAAPPIPVCSFSFPFLWPLASRIGDGSFSFLFMGCRFPAGCGEPRATRSQRPSVQHCATLFAPCCTVRAVPLRATLCNGF